MSELSKKPYVIRAIYEWCADSSLTPYLTVKVDQNVRVPMEYVKNGEIVLSISLQATRNLTIGNDLVQFSARFNGVSREISIPIYAVQAIFARENGQGFFFEAEDPPAGITDTHAVPVTSSPLLHAVSVAPAVSPVSELNASKGEGSPHQDDANRHTQQDDNIATTAVVTRLPDTDPDKPKAPPRGNLRIIK